MKRVMGLVALILTLAVALSFTGCATTKLSEAFDQAAVEAKAKEVIDTLNTGDYEGVSMMVREDLRPQLSASVIEGAVAQIYGDAGPFSSYENISVVGKKIEEADAAIALVQTKYGKQKVTFTLMLNQKLELIGFFIK